MQRHANQGVVVIEGLKPFYTRLLKPMIGLFVRLHLRPSHLTLSGVVLFLLAGALVAGGFWYWSAACVTLGAFMDGWDGLLAREKGMKTRFGAILDSTCDRMTEIAWIGGIVYFYFANDTGTPLYGWGVALGMAGLAGSLMVSYVKARCEGEGIRCGEGILQRPERIFLVGIGQLIGPRAMVGSLALLSMLSWYTVLQRLMVARKRTGENPAQ